jgi:large subunit ribosomal protein L9
VQVLRGARGRHQLQGHADAVGLRARAWQSAAAPHLRHLRAAPAQAPHGHHAGAPDCAPALRDLGVRGQIVKVADGYARNYLLPRKLALLATEGNKKRVERERKIAEAREAEEREASQAIATRLSALELAFTRKVGETEQLYGSVTNQDLADALKAKGFDVDRRKILLPDAIKALGEFTVPVKLHRDVTAQLKVTVSKE